MIDAIADCLRRAKENGEMPSQLREREAAAHLHATVVGMRVLAKGGARPEMLRGIANTAVKALKASTSK